MKKITILLCFIAAAVFLVSCKNNAGDPKATVSAFFEAMSKRDMETVKKLATVESQGMIQMMEMGMKMAKVEGGAEKFDKSRAEIGAAVINGDEATVPVKDKVSGESTNIILKKQGGEWKVTFDMETIAKMTQDKMKQQGMSEADIKMATDQMKHVNMDSINLMIKSMKDINLDSLKKTMNGNSKTIDSVMQSLQNIK